MPLVICAGPFKGGKEVTELVSTESIPKTLLALAGVDVCDKMIGENLLDVVEKKNHNRANEVYAQISESRCGRCIRTADYMYSVYAPGVNGGEAAASDVYADDFLYDMQKDPTEKERLPMLSAAEKKSDQVYRWLLAYIDENKFSGNQRLPSENALCRKLGVSRETIRVAIDRLVNEGIVYKVKGSGTYFHREKVMTRDLNTEDALYKIGLVLQGQDTSANSGLIEGVRSVLTQERVDLHVFLTDNKFCNERRCLETVVHQNFHGFIVDGVKSSILSPNLDCYKELYRRKIPVIFYNNFYRNLRCPRVTINDIECAHQLIGRLIDAGHSHIAGIFVYDNYQSVEKFQGMAEAMRNRGLELNDDYIKWCISDEAHNESYVRSIERFLKRIPKCTAIVCCNYIIYRLVMKTLQKMGKTVPEDYSLVCFDYSEETYRQEDVTCSVEQGFEMGRQLALRLMEMISTGECDDRNYTYVMKPILYDGHSIRKLKKVK